MIRAAVLFLLAAPATASDRFIPPVGCEGVVTVQSRGCELDNIYVCTADTPGDSWRVSFHEDGPKFIGRIDAETQWMESIDLFPTRREVIELPAADPASLSELLETGTDAFDFNMRGPGGEVTRVVGFDQLTGEEVVIDGEALLRTAFSARYESTTSGTTTITGNEYVSPALGRFLSGSYRHTSADGAVTEWANDPVDFIFPGEPGFFSKTPLYECEASLARFTPSHEGADQ
ncbi:hypothetical protein [uncultured Tateyamaria sp.]|uniref:hypothetical protein n=1 Tax=Tateyamaria sp. 1078 TaxID=3417464 RepID=UPI002638FFC4|nr:hypothetical protein [uncultured Tateyamaria sp.]